MAEEDGAGVNFYELPEAERRAITERAMQQKSSLSERWLSAMDPNPHPLWERRAELAAGYLSDVAGVSDFGCGAMLLERKLSQSTQYVPFDIVQRDIRTTVIDLNMVEPPAVPGVEAAACLGLLEYLHHLQEVLRALRRHYEVAAISYACSAGGNVGGRRAHGWMNDHTLSEMEALLRQCDWRVVDSDIVAKSHHIWHVR